MREKISPELELALASDSYSPGSSLYLGYNSAEDIWSLVIRHAGNIDDLTEQVIRHCVYLMGGFAVIDIYTANIDILQKDPRILYIDKSNYFSYGVDNISYEKYTSCVTKSFAREYGLYGDGVCVGIIDSGLNIQNREFVNANGSRLVAYWNQNEKYSSDTPNRYRLGHIYDRDGVKKAYEDGESIGGGYSTHGTEITSIAAGTYTGIASQSDIIMVEQSLERNMPDTISIMMGLDYLVRYSIDNSQPMVINLSYGNNFGAHDGSSMLELYIDTVSVMGRISVVTGTGNDGSRELHTSGMLGNVSFADIDVAVSGGVNNFGLQIWKSYVDSFDVILYSPSYDMVAYLTEGQMVSGAVAGVTRIYGIFQDPSPLNIKQLIYIFFQSRKKIEQGVWHVRLMPKSIVNGIYNAYLPSPSYITGRVAFENSSAFGTLTIPATSGNVISVAAYDQNTGAMASFSGRGFTADNMVKPDIAAPGVGVTVSTGEGMYALADGTSISAAFVSGSAALLMEWGIVRGNDSFMYGEKLKAQLIRGARQPDKFGKYPNRYIGWGTLCVRNSIPMYTI